MPEGEQRKVTPLSELFSKPPVPRVGVRRTRELDRILSLPRRQLDLDTSTREGASIPDLTPLYLKFSGPCEKYPACPVCASGSAKLWPAQSAALLEAELGYGLFAALGVGAGKTLISLLLPDVFQSKKTVLLVPPGLRNQLLERDIADYGRHFNISSAIQVAAYSELSTVGGADVLEKARPDLVIADECHHLSVHRSSRTKRFVRFFQQHPEVRLCALSGTVTKRSLCDFSHLSEIALRAGSPVPQRWSDLSEWADALDPISAPLPVGALKVLAPGDPRLELGEVEARQAVREGFRRRLVDTPGVIATSESWEGASLVVQAVRPAVPEIVKKTLNDLRRTWEIGGEEINSAMRMSEIARQVSIGFYYRWLWPDDRPDTEWLFARAAWNKATRIVLQHSREGLDSPLLVARAAKRGELGKEVAEVYSAWKKLEARYDPHPPVGVVWLHPFVLDYVKSYVKLSDAPTIIWYSHAVVGERLTGTVPIFGAGTDAGTADPKKHPVIACSIAAQGTGKNLQQYSRGLVVEPPMSGAVWEQMIGREHRPGQQADEVWIDSLAHTLELEGALHRALADARYVFETQGQKQKLLVARRVGW